MACKLIDADKANGKTYHTIADFEAFIAKINMISKGTSLKYKINPTQKYIQIKCSACGTFAYWYKNNKDINIEDFCNVMDKKVANVKRDAAIDIMFFRGINKNHEMSKHQDMIGYF